MVKISPSILSCDYAKMGEEFERMKRCGADWLHIDRMNIIHKDEKIVLNF